MSELHWPELVFLGMSAVCVMVLAVSAGLIVWRFLHPLN